MLKLVDITLDNVSQALEVFHSIFSWIPAEADPYTSMLKGVMPEICPHYYLVYDDENVVGITGSYIVPEDPDSAFLGWFGVCPAMRRNHYGSKLLTLHEDQLRKLGYKYSRLYTETNNNAATRTFYERNGYVGEDYNCAADYGVRPNTITVYSKPLSDAPLVAWNNRNMNLTEELKHVYPEDVLKQGDALMEKMANAAHE